MHESQKSTRLQKYIVHSLNLQISHAIDKLIENETNWTLETPKNPIFIDQTQTKINTRKKKYKNKSHLLKLTIHESRESTRLQNSIVRSLTLQIIHAIDK